MAITGEQRSHTLALVTEALAAAERFCGARHTEELVHPFPEPRLHGLTRSLNSVAERVGLHVARTSYMGAVEAFRYDLFSKWAGAGTVFSVLEAPESFDAVYGVLTDETSRRVYDWYIRCRVAYAVVGDSALCLFPPSESRLEYSRLTSTIGRRREQGCYAVGNWKIDSALNVIVDSIVLEQYNLAGLVEPRKGWVAFDVGAYKGETSIWLAGKLGSLGKVFAFEPNPKTSLVLQSNVDLNDSPEMAPIRVVPLGIGASSGTRSFVGTADGSSYIDDAGETDIQVTTIDGFMGQDGMDRVDFIKMDIEGGEVDAVKGAKATLRDFAPSLAICVYHRPRDLPDVVAAIRQARPDYQFYLSHKSPGLTETVLFARVEPRIRGTLDHA
jgi:FkbM family methyltransferase